MDIQKWIGLVITSEFCRKTVLKRCCRPLKLSAGTYLYECTYMYAFMKQMTDASEKNELNFRIKMSTE